MKAALKRRWVAALRSGKYKQGTGTLYDPLTKTYCCLGVLGRCAGERRLAGWGVLRDGARLGLTYDVEERLACLNDSGKWSFKRIATYIERYL